ncbi:hypothetical protein PLESTB_000370500 [Pleodorina starrii]|uniref:Channelopsin 1 n=1 Tax=Pleodorina starrii TaxID=330485 RepID=A0A9W6BEJ7_9CHLO|nr:hypothetical protein PLESTM_000024400 [Pleodorina starrii]GLC50360.1 hypothetical protein PLESTB_000370500 [Pleodorina starrii]GLC64258.1 hypothetical protein PLESTF_000142200 [Pleodorina starrii]
MERFPFDLGNGTVCHAANTCYCEGWLHSRGTDLEKRAAQTLQWVTFGISVATLLWYAFQGWRATCGWEEVYVAIIETLKSIMEAFYEFDTPAMLYLSTGVPVVWLRYGEWLLTCPVLLIHLSNLTGLNNDYSVRTMALLISDVGCIVWGATAAMCRGYLRLIFFLIACVYGAYTFFHAGKVYIEAYHVVPKGLCRRLVISMACLYFCSWGMFPVLFAVGPEGLGHISLYGSSIGHCILDLFSKNVWGILGNALRVKIHQHIMLYGDIRKRQTIMIAGQEVEIETFAAEDGDDDGSGGNHSSKVVIKVRSRASTDMPAITKVEIPTYSGRASVEGSKPMRRVSVGGFGAASARVSTETVGVTKVVPRISFGASSPASCSDRAAAVATFATFAADDAADDLEPGRVVLAVPDAAMVDVFEEQFSQLPVPYEVVPTYTVDDTLRAASQPGCNFVLMHPDFLRDRGPTGLLPRLRAAGNRAAAFGWSPKGPARSLIEDSSLDGWLEGPAFGRAINAASLHLLVLKMQQARPRNPGMQPTGEGGTGSGDQPRTPALGSGRASLTNNFMPSVRSGLAGTASGSNSSSSGSARVLATHAAAASAAGGLSPTAGGTMSADPARPSGATSIRIMGGGMAPEGGGNLPTRLSGQGRMALGSGTGSARLTGQGSGGGAGGSSILLAAAGGGGGSGVNMVVAASGVGGKDGDAGDAGLTGLGSACFPQQQQTSGEEADILTSLSAPQLQEATQLSPRPGSRLSNNPLFGTLSSPRNSRDGLSVTASRPLSPVEPAPAVTPAVNADDGPCIVSAFNVDDGA